MGLARLFIGGSNLRRVTCESRRNNFRNNIAGYSLVIDLLIEAREVSPFRRQL